MERFSVPSHGKTKVSQLRLESKDIRLPPLNLDPEPAAEIQLSLSPRTTSTIGMGTGLRKLDTHNLLLKRLIALFSNESIYWKASSVEKTADQFLGLARSETFPSKGASWVTVGRKEIG